MCRLKCVCRRMNFIYFKRHRSSNHFRSYLPGNFEFKIESIFLIGHTNFLFFLDECKEKTSFRSMGMKRLFSINKTRDDLQNNILKIFLSGSLALHCNYIDIPILFYLSSIIFYFKMIMILGFP